MPSCSRERQGKMSIIDIKNLTFGYEGSTENVFENVSFRLDTDWKLGFTGRNGRGKTTLLNLLLGKYQYKGSITSSVGFEYFPYEIGVSRQKSDALRSNDSTESTALDVAREIYNGFEDWELSRELSLLGVGSELLTRPYSTLSMGERTKILLAVMFLKPDSFMLIDEPTNHLDSHARVLTAGYLNTKKGFILVSHDRAFLDACTDHTLSINRSDITVTAGNFSVWYENKTLQDSFELSQNDKLKREISRLNATAREKSAWSDISEGRKIGFDPRKTEKNMGRRAYEGAKSKKMMSRSKSISKRTEEKIDEKSSLLKNIEEFEDLKLNPIEFYSKRLCEFDGVSVYYGERKAVGEVDLRIQSGERICLSGANGSGKSTLIKLILGKNLVYTGEFYRAPGLRISYVPQDVSALSGSLEDFENQSDVDRILLRAILRKLDFSREMFERPLETYSAGQKKKAVLAKSLAERAHLYIWDEPLNYIDIYSRMQIEKLLTASRATALFVEHDRAFCEAAATMTLKL